MIRIYGLTDPRDGRVRYIGQTKLRLEVRLRVHLRNARLGKGGGRALREWLAGLLAEGLEPIVLPLEEVEPARALEVEAGYISVLPALVNTASWGNVRFPSHAVWMLGLMPDAEVAQRVGMDERAVMRARKRHGVASYASQTGNDGRFRAAAA